METRRVSIFTMSSKFNSRLVEDVRFNSLKKEDSMVKYVCNECGYDIQKDPSIKFVPTNFPNNGSAWEWAPFSYQVKTSHLKFYSEKYKGTLLASHTDEKFFKAPLIEFAREIGAHF